MDKRFDQKSEEMRARMASQKRTPKVQVKTHQSKARMKKTGGLRIITSKRPLHVWERWPNESIEEYKRFQIFLFQGNTRSIQRTMRMLDVTTQLATLAKDFDWHERAFEYDQAQSKQALGTIEKERRLELNERERREIIRRHMAWNLTEGLHERAMEMLAFPISEEKVTEVWKVGENGQKYLERTVTKTPKFNYRDLASMAETFAKLSVANTLEKQSEAADGAPAGKLIAGSFSLYSGVPEPPPPVTLTVSSERIEGRLSGDDFSLPPLDRFPTLDQ